LRQRAVELVFETIEQRDGVRYGVVRVRSMTPDIPQPAMT